MIPLKTPVSFRWTVPLRQQQKSKMQFEKFSHEPFSNTLTN
jgi:hypothetical protein